MHELGDGKFSASPGMAYMLPSVQAVCACCAELHEKEAQLWEAFSKEARSNTALAPYWELLAMYDGQQEEDAASRKHRDLVADKQERAVQPLDNPFARSVDQDLPADDTLMGTSAATFSAL